jgi:hypothetical protein
VIIAIDHVMDAQYWDHSYSIYHVCAKETNKDERLVSPENTGYATICMSIEMTAFWKHNNFICIYLASRGLVVP